VLKRPSGWYAAPPGAHLAKAKPRPILVAYGDARFPKAETLKLTVKLKAKGLQLLEHAKRLKLTAVGTFTPKGKAAIRVSKAFILRAETCRCPT
jgi:hypothetical protein